MSWLPELAAITASPFDDAPRLALADALERAGEVDRATFIRLQCHPGPGMYDQARKLLEASSERAAAWSGLAPALAGMVDTAMHRYRRGLIDTLHFRDPGVFASLAGELKASPATVWQLHGQEPYAYESAGPFPNVRRIELHAMAECSRDVVGKLAARNVEVPDADALPARISTAEGPASGKANTPETLKHALRYFEPGTLLTGC